MSLAEAVEEQGPLPVASVLTLAAGWRRVLRQSTERAWCTGTWSLQTCCSRTTGREQLRQRPAGGYQPAGQQLL